MCIPAFRSRNWYSSNNNDDMQEVAQLKVGVHIIIRPATNVGERDVQRSSLGRKKSKKRR